MKGNSLLWLLPVSEVRETNTRPLVTINLKKIKSFYVHCVEMEMRLDNKKLAKGYTLYHIIYIYIYIKLSERGKTPPPTWPLVVCGWWPIMLAEQDPGGWAVLDPAIKVVTWLATSHFSPYWTRRPVEEARFDQASGHVKPKHLYDFSDRILQIL